MRVLVLFATSGMEVADLEVDSSTRVLSLHRMVAAVTNVPVTRQQLLRGTEVLLRCASLEQSGVVDNDTLKLVVDPHMVCIWGPRDSFVKICCAKTGECVETLDGHEPEFTEDGCMVLTQTAQDTVTIWNTSTWTRLQTLTADRTIAYKKFSPDGSLVLTSHHAVWMDGWIGSGQIAEDSSVRIWNVSTGACLHTLTMGGSLGDEHSESFSPDGTMVCIHMNRWDSINIWNVATGECVRTFDELCDYAMFSPISSLLCTTSDITTKIWNVGTGECLQTLVGGNAVFSSDGSKLLSLTTLGVATIWDSFTFVPLQTFEPAQAFRAHPMCISHKAQFSRDGSLVLGDICCNIDRFGDPSSGNFIIWNATTGESVQTLSIPEWVQGEFSRDGSLLLTWSKRWDGPQRTISIWDVQTGECLMGFNEKGPLHGALLF